MDIWSLLSDIVILLSGALVLGGLFARYGQSPLIGYLLAGMLLGGPGGLQLIQSEEKIEIIAELGVALLLFGLGLEFSISKLRKMGSMILMCGALQVIVTLIAVAGVSYLFGLSFQASVAVGAMFCLSSTAVVLRLLMENGEIETVHGNRSIAVLLVQDMAVVPLAVMVSLLNGGSDTGAIYWHILSIIGLAAIVVVSLYFLLHVIAVRTLGVLTLERNRDLTVILSVVTGLGSTWAAHYAGISPALGAFVAGMFIGSSPFATQVRADVSSIRVVLLTLFFGSAGMVADPLWMIQNFPLVVSFTALIMIGKGVIVSAIFRFAGFPASIAIACGVVLAQIGEFAFVLGSIARQSNLIDSETYLLLVSTTITSLFFSAYLIPNATLMGKAISGKLPGTHVGSHDEHHSEHLKPDIVLIGFGYAARAIAGLLDEFSYDVLVIELNRQGLEQAHRQGFHGLIGDATQHEVLEHAGVSSAKAIVITVPHHHTALEIVRQVRRMAPESYILCRSRYDRNLVDLTEAGAHDVIGDESQSGNELARQLKEWITNDSQIPG